MDGVDFEEECYFLDGISQFCGDSSPEVADNAESNIDRNIIMAKQLNDNSTGEELYANCTELLVNSGGTFGKSIVMNRVIRYYMTYKKLKLIETCDRWYRHGAQFGIEMLMNKGSVLHVVAARKRVRATFRKRSLSDSQEDSKNLYNRKKIFIHLYVTSSLSLEGANFLGSGESLRLRFRKVARTRLRATTT